MTTGITDFERKKFTAMAALTLQFSMKTREKIEPFHAMYPDKVTPMINEINRVQNDSVKLILMLNE